MAKQTKTNHLVGKRIGNNSQILLAQKEENNFHFSPAELKEYNEIDPSFGKKYLENLIEIPKQIATQNKVFQYLFIVAIIVAILMILGYLTIIGVLIYLGHITSAVTIITVSFVALFSALFTFIRNNKEK
jgi:hypothetical protein